MKTPAAPQLQKIETAFAATAGKQTQLLMQYRQNPDLRDSLKANMATLKQLRKQYAAAIREALPGAENEDTNYIFLYFVTHNLPKGVVGLLISVIIMAAWGSIAAALNSLASSSVIDLHCKFTRRPLTEAEKYSLSWKYTLGWGIFCIAVAMFATNMGSLIEAVNVLGSIFYGVILGIFLVAFFTRSVKGDAVFWAAVVTQLVVVTIYNMEIVSFLWLNLIGVVGVWVISWLAQLLQPIINHNADLPVEN
jgi:Na+/proline symporter